jgi:hypothetical protein
MNNFIPPVKGTKLGELNPSWFERLYYSWVSEPFVTVINIVWRWGILVALPIVIGVKFIKAPFNPEWISWLVAIILCLVGIFFAFVQIFVSFPDKRRKTVQISDKKIAIFLVNNGVEINEHFIPFKDTNSNNYDGIVSFKLDGDYLMLKTEGENFIWAYWELNENQMKFKIESKYAFCKDELLSYLNNLIPEN